MMMKKTPAEKELPECNRCIYPQIGGCPCGNSLHNAACLTIFKDVSEWGEIFHNTVPLLEQYESSRPKADELIFVQSVCDKNVISRKEAPWVIRELRRAKRRMKE